MPKIRNMLWYVVYITVKIRQGLLSRIRGRLRHSGSKAVTSYVFEFPCNCATCNPVWLEPWIMDETTLQKQTLKR